MGENEQTRPGIDMARVYLLRAWGFAAAAALLLAGAAFGIMAIVADDWWRPALGLASGVLGAIAMLAVHFSTRRWLPPE